MTDIIKVDLARTDCEFSLPEECEKDKEKRNLNENQKILTPSLRNTIDRNQQRTETTTYF